MGGWDQRHGYGVDMGTTRQCNYGVDNGMPISWGRAIPLCTRDAWATTFVSAVAPNGAGIKSMESMNAGYGADWVEPTDVVATGKSNGINTGRFGTGLASLRAQSERG